HGVTGALQPVDHVAEVSEVGLVRADVLGGIDCVELHAEPVSATSEANAVDIRQNDELVELLQVGERGGRVGKSRPIADRAAESAVIRRRRSNAPLLGKPAVDEGEELRIDHVRRLGFLYALQPGKWRQNIVAGARE